MNSEIHTIVAIGDMELSNVTGISQVMHMTRGAISKITKRLIENGLIESYMVEGNNQKVFFKLTDKGQELYKEHEVRHNLWLERDNAFLQKYSKEELNEIQRFMLDFNNYLEDKIAEIGGKTDVN